MAPSKTATVLAIAFTCLIISPAAFAATRISAAQARAAAVQRIPGKPISTKYEYEDGHWQYAVLVEQGRALYEVEVNAQTGKVTDTERTTLSEEKKEAGGEGGD